jgi:hypothetical protein
MLKKKGARPLRSQRRQRGVKRQSLVGHLSERLPAVERVAPSKERSRVKDDVARVLAEELADENAVVERHHDDVVDSRRKRLAEFALRRRDADGPILQDIPHDRAKQTNVRQIQVALALGIMKKGVVGVLVRTGEMAALHRGQVGTKSRPGRMELPQLLEDICRRRRRRSGRRRSRRNRGRRHFRKSMRKEYSETEVY